MKRKTMKRINAAEFMPDFHIKVVKGDKKSKRVLKRMGYEVTDGADAITACDGDECVVCLLDRFFDDEKSMDSTIAHEAVHCAQGWVRSIFEDEPGDEEMAYMVEACYLAIREQL